METIYFGLIIFLFLLAFFDLIVGVSNDAVNFLNSAIGSKAAPFKVIIAIAAIGIFCGATMSNGMMEITRHGIFRPEQFFFVELLCIFLAVMIVDVVLLDVFNSLGMPTSTTVSMVFELLGATFALSLVKILADDTGLLTFGDLLNTEKAFSVVTGIFLSVAIAFFFGTLVQYLTRLVFTFDYRKRLKYIVGIFGGLAATSIVYFMLIKGSKDASFMTPEVKACIKANSGQIVLGCFLFFSVLMQILHFLRVNVLKVVVLMGTFALAMAFAGNDLVNFIGVPLAGFSAYSDYVANGLSVGAEHYLMEALREPAKTPFVFLFAAGVIMVFALVMSKKAQNVVKTELGLSRQDEGNEMFGSSALARSLVRKTMTVSTMLSRIVPVRLSRWVDRRFNREDVMIEKGASFDLVRAAINLVLAGLLIAVGTSWKLPLSTTYVTFMVAMGTSLADRAWGRESAVFRITGTLSVIGGWFVTAGAAFVLSFCVALLLHFGGIVAMVIMIGFAAFLLIRSNILYRKKRNREYSDETFDAMMTSKNPMEVWKLLRSHLQQTFSETVRFAAGMYTDSVDAFIHEDLNTLRKVRSELNQKKDELKKNRRREMVILQRVDRNIALEKNTWFHLASNSAQQMIYSLRRMNEPCREHVDNHFHPLPEGCRDEFMPVAELLKTLMFRIRTSIENNDYSDYEQLFFTNNHITEEFSRLRHNQIGRMQENECGLNVSLVYLNMLQESQELVSILRHLLRAMRKFQTD